MSYLQWGLISAGGFLVGCLLALLGLVLLPADYFTDGKSRPFRRRTMSGKIHWVVKNVSGVVLIVIGVVLLFLPGQGLLTVVVGLMLVDFPGKHRLVRQLLSRPRLVESANRWRAKFNRPPLVRPVGS